MSKYGVVLDDFGLETMLDKLMCDFVRPISKGDVFSMCPGCQHDHKVNRCDPLILSVSHMSLECMQFSSPMLVDPHWILTMVLLSNTALTKMST